MGKKRGDLWVLLAAALVVAAFTLPMFKSGGKQGITLFEFIRNHTIFFDKSEPLYIPKEDYMSELAPDYMSEIKDV